MEEPPFTSQDFGLVYLIFLKNKLHLFMVWAGGVCVFVRLLEYFYYEKHCLSK